MEGGDHPLLQIIFPGPGACRSAGGGAAGAGVAGRPGGPVWWDGAQPTQERRGAGLSQGVAAGKTIPILYLPITATGKLLWTGWKKSGLLFFMR